MAGTRDNTAPNWKRALARLRRNVVELQNYGYEVIEPVDIERPRPVAPRPRRTYSQGTTSPNEERN